MVSVYGASASREFVAKGSDESLVFMPVDWAVEHHTTGFREASESLTREGLKVDSYDERARAVSDSFVTVLEHCRGQNPVLKDAILLVECADCGGTWQELEREAVRKLNGPAVFSRWAATIENP